jgi:ankyrin repeat protein
MVILMIAVVSPLMADGGDFERLTFFDAVSSGDVDGAKNFLDTQEAAINDQDAQGNTGLILAVEKEDLNMVLALVGYGPDIEVTNNEGKTAVDVANEKGNIAIQQALNGL